MNVIGTRNAEMFISEPGLSLGYIQSSVAQTEDPLFEGGKQQ